MRNLLCTAALLPLAVATAEVPTDPVGKGEFPGLQFLPPGSILKGISLPRYEAHRVSSLLMAGQLEVKTGSLVILRDLHTFFYLKDGDTVEMTSDEARGDFERSLIIFPKEITMASPKIEIKGKGFVFSRQRNMGLIKGPVQTSVVSEGDSTDMPIVPAEK